MHDADVGIAVTEVLDLLCDRGGRASARALHGSNMRRAPLALLLVGATLAHNTSVYDRPLPALRCDRGGAVDKSREVTAEPALFFVHVFKAAGSSVRGIFRTYAEKCAKRWACLARRPRGVEPSRRPGRGRSNARRSVASVERTARRKKIVGGGPSSSLDPHPPARADRGRELTAAASRRRRPDATRKNETRRARRVVGRSFVSRKLSGGWRSRHRRGGAARILRGRIAAPPRGRRADRPSRVAAQERRVDRPRTFGGARRSSASGAARRRPRASCRAGSATR